MNKTTLMKTIILAVLVLFNYPAIKAQQRDLDFYIQAAVQNSPLINKSTTDQKIIALDLQLMRSLLYKPEITLDANALFAPIISHDNHSNQFEWISNGATDYTGYDLAITDGGQYQAVVALKQPLFERSGFRQYSNLANIRQQINSNEIALAGHEIEFLVSRQYLLCIKSKKQERNSAILLDEMKQQLLTLRALVENAIYKQTDLMLLEIEVQNFEIEYRSFQADYQNNVADLNLLSGISDTGKVDLQELDFQLSTAIYSYSGFAMKYKLDSLNLIIDQSVSELKYKPQVNLFANAGLTAAYQPTINRFGFSTGIGFSMNVFDGHQRGTTREKTKILLQINEFEKSQFITQKEVSKNKFLNQINALNDQIAITRRQTEQYESLLNAYTLELLTGEISIMDFKTLMKDVSTKKQEYLMLIMEKQAMMISYNYWNF
jgi:outer membrane protein TolC